jgi:flavin reductase (DIM6/NTAB) family NADH-FMN oxidoreductase RutF
MDPLQFRQLSSLWATGVSVVTTVAENGQYYGLTVNGLTSLSLEPPLFLICIDRKSDTLEPLTSSRVFCINILTAEQQGLAERFATKGQQKFANMSAVRGRLGAPLIQGALAALECRVSRIVEGGDHVIFIGELAANHIGRGEPLIFFRNAYTRLPKPA